MKSTSDFWDRVERRIGVACLALLAVTLLALCALAWWLARAG